MEIIEMIDMDSVQLTFISNFMKYYYKFLF